MVKLVTSTGLSLEDGIKRILSDVVSKMKQSASKVMSKELLDVTRAHLLAR